MSCPEEVYKMLPSAGGAGALWGRRCQHETGCAVRGGTAVHGGGAWDGMRCVRERACVKERTVSSGGGGGACGGRSAGRWRGGAGACVEVRGAAAAAARLCAAEAHGWHALKSCGLALEGGMLEPQKVHVVRAMN